MYELHEKEKEVMEIFWKLNKPCLISEILCESPSLSRSTVSQVLVRLERKGFLKVDSIQRSITKAGRAYVPLISKEQYEAQEGLCQVFTDRKQLHNNTLRLVSCLLKTTPVDSTFLDELKQIIAECENQKED